MGSIPANDEDFLEWCKDQSLLSYGLGVREAMVVYMDQLNLESSERYEREMKEHKAWLLSSKSGDTEENPVQSNEPEPSETKAPDGTDGTTMNIPNPQNIFFPNSQNIPSPDSQNIPNPGPQNNSAPPVRGLV